MGVEAKKMSKSITADEGTLTGRMKLWPERTRSFYHDVRTEMRKVTSPSLKEVQATTAVVIITVALFAIYFWLVDAAISNGVNYLFHWFAHRG